MLEKFPGDAEIIVSFEKACKDSGNLECAITIWSKLVELYLNELGLQIALEEACVENGVPEKTFSVWHALTEKFPEDEEILTSFIRACENRPQRTNNSHLEAIGPQIPW